MSNRWKRIRASNATALISVLGERLKLVVVILILIGWTGDALLNLLNKALESLLMSGEGDAASTLISPDLVVLALTLSGLSFVWLSARKASYADMIQASKGEDPDNKKVVVMVLSPYQPRDILTATQSFGERTNNPGYRFDELDEMLPQLQPQPAKALCYTPYQCNWLPALKALEEFKYLEKVIVITTAHSPGAKKPDGSTGQFSLFVKLVKKHLRHDVEILEHSTFLKETKYEQADGVNSQDMVLFTNTAATIIDKLLADGALSKEIIVDVTGGFASMSAAMASVSVLNDIEAHYVGTNDFKLQTLDVKVQTRQQ